MAGVVNFGIIIITSQVFKLARRRPGGDPRETADISARETGRPAPIQPRPRIGGSCKFWHHYYYVASL